MGLLDLLLMALMGVGVTTPGERIGGASLSDDDEARFDDGYGDYVGDGLDGTDDYVGDGSDGSYDDNYDDYDDE